MPDPTTFCRVYCLLAVLLAVAGCGPHEAAQDTTHATSPYAGEEVRAVKALAPEEIGGLRTGQGLGYAKAAELNHYPGPRHVLDLADSLGLNAEQRARTRATFERMRAEAVPLGEQIVAKEIMLDSLFAHQHASPEAVRSALDEIGALEAELRFVHLNAHLALKETLTAEQVQRYDALRGYGGDDHTRHDAQHRH